MKVAGLFAGIGGIEVGLHRSGHETKLLCEVMENAKSVLSARFPETKLIPDVRDLRALPRDVELLAAGFPCQNLSQAGMVAGIGGSQSGLVNEVFRVMRLRYPKWLLIENVQFMLQLGRGDAMRHIVSELEAMKMRWAYRVVDSRFSGVAQRRRRVIFLASRTEDPRAVLFADDAGERNVEDFNDDAFGFYWTEGLRGLGWAKDAVPTLKGGSTIGIPSPPAIWVPAAEVGRKLIVPTVEDGEELQGFERGWTAPAKGTAPMGLGPHGARSRGAGDPTGCEAPAKGTAVDGNRTVGSRWKLVGNAVTVGVSEWVGHRLENPGEPMGIDVPLVRTGSWPAAAWGEKGKAWQVTGLSEFPVHRPYRHLLDTVRASEAPSLSHRAASGFLSRTRKAKLRFDPLFIKDVQEHVEFTRKPGDLADAG